MTAPVSSHDVTAFSPEPGLDRKILAHNPRLMLVEHVMQVRAEQLDRLRAAAQPALEWRGRPCPCHSSKPHHYCRCVVP